MRSARHKRRWTLAALSLWMGMLGTGIGGLSGCTSFREDRAALQSYERTRQSMSGSVQPVSYEQEVDDGGLDIQDISPSRIGQRVKSIAGYGPNQQLAEQYFDDGRRLYDAATREFEIDPDSETAADTFVLAGEAFYDAAARWPESRLEQEALYYAGDSFFFANEYAQANQSLELLIHRYPGTRFLDLAQARRFAIAQYWLQLDRRDPDNLLTFHVNDGTRPLRDTQGNALRILNRIRIDDPTGRLADDATMALANAYFADGRFLDAADTYEDLRITFPTSQHQFDAHIFELRARVEAYQGSAYDGTHLEKADKLLSAVLTQFPSQSEIERAELQKLAAEIRFRLAERGMKMARYYDYSGQYRSATIYYQQVAQTFPGTPQAEEASERILAIADKPAKPPQRARWLVNLFPESSETKPLIANSPTTDAIQ